ncbi:hypothetical protein OF83DRAFT_495447 [Amylostereum chailletii]|nr:hypothetical protein OF83DRAFT_495447 [Amylostereum chailletii]
MCPSLHQPSASFDVKSRESASHEICSPFYDTVETLRAHLDSDNSEASMSSGSGSLCATPMFSQPVWASGPLYGPAKIPAHILSQFQSRAAIKEGSTPSSSSSSCVNPSGEELPVLSSPPSPTVSEGGLDFSNFFEDDTEDSDDEGGYDSCSDADARSVKSDLSLRCRGLSPTGSQASQGRRPHRGLFGGRLHCPRRWSYLVFYPWSIG